MGQPVFTPTELEEGKMYRFMQQHRRFLYADVLRATSVSQFCFDRFVAKLRLKGILKKCGREGTNQFFTIMDSDAAMEFARTKRGSREGAIWTVMRELREFTAQEVGLALVGTKTAIDEVVIHKYCQTLLKGDYLKVLRKARPGVHLARYRLVKDTGPLPPTQRTLQVVVDGNDEKAVWVSGVRL